MNKHEILSLSEQKNFLLNGIPVSVFTGNEVPLIQKLLDSSSNPALIPATCQEVVSKKRLHNPRVPAIVKCNRLSNRKSKHF